MNHISAAWDRSHAPTRVWRADPWRVEVRDDELADISFDGRLVLRSIRAVVRDRDWNTAAWRIDGIRDTADTLVIELSSNDLGLDMGARVRMRARGDALDIAFEASPRADFATNRTGLVILHPPTVAGQDVTVGHPDGTQTQSRFPESISPHQPVEQISALSWQHEGVDVQMQVAGDVFEMEDQRNWTDASFKTYSRPLSLPFPYTVRAGERVEQSVSLSASVVAPPSPRDSRDRIRLRLGGRFPDVGVGSATAPDAAPTTARVAGSFVLVELDLRSPTWRAALDRAAGTELPLEVRLILSDDADALTAATEALAARQVARVAAFQSDGDAQHVSDSAAVAALRSACGAAGVNAKILGGVRSHFTELNREHARIPDDTDAIVFGVTPLFHSTSTEQLVESLAMQRLVALQAVSMAGSRPVYVGPITLRPHFNNVATTPPPISPFTDLRAGYGPELIDADDARQESPELAAWTIASAAALAVPGVAGLAYFEQWGPRGLRSSTGDRLPVADAVDDLTALAGGLLYWGDSPDGLCWALGAERGDRATILVANLSCRERRVTVELPDGTTRSASVAARTYGRVPAPHLGPGRSEPECH